MKHRQQGGRRPGAGRPKTGNVVMLFRIRPEIAASIRQRAQDHGRTISAEFQSLWDFNGYET